MLAVDPDARVSNLERNIKEEKHNFGASAFDYLRDRWVVASLVPAQLDEIYQEYFSLVATLEADLLKKQKQWNDGEL